MKGGHKPMQKGQLGHNDLLQCNVPTLIASMKGKDVVTAAAGKHHTALVLADGMSYTFGSNLTVRL